MGQLMQKIADTMDKNKDFRFWFWCELSPWKFISSDLVRCFEDPTENESVREMLENFYKKTTIEKDMDPVDKRYFSKIRKEMDTLLGEVKANLNIT